MFYAVTPRGETIAYCRYPGNDPVLLVHGFGSNAAATWQTSGWLRALADAGRGALAVDLRGHGESSKPHESAAYLPGVFASDLACVLDAEELEAVDVMGYSMGSQICRALAAVAPDRISRLILGGIGPREQFGLWGADTVRAILLGEQAGELDAAAVAILRAAADAPGADRDALAACAVGVASEALPNGEMAMPTLLAAGELDPVAVGAADFAATLGAQFVEVPGRNHMTTLSSRALKAGVLDFLAA